MSDGLMLFAFGGTGTYFLLQLEAGTLLWKVSINGAEHSFMFNKSISLCDGQWHKVELTRRPASMEITVDSVTENDTVNANQAGEITLSSYLYEITLSSYLYVGGIPDDDDEAATFIQRKQLGQQIQRSQ